MFGAKVSAVPGSVSPREGGKGPWEGGDWEKMGRERDRDGERGKEGGETPRASLQERNPAIETANTKDSRKERAHGGWGGPGGPVERQEPNTLPASVHSWAACLWEPVLVVLTGLGPLRGAGSALSLLMDSKLQECGGLAEFTGAKHTFRFPSKDSPSARHLPPPTPRLNSKEEMLWGVFGVRHHELKAISRCWH